MDTSKLKKFAQYARRYLMEQVAAKMKYVLAADSQFRRENPKAVEDLEHQIRSTSQEQVIEKVAYIWFNRFCAIRFMDANRYTRIGILSPAEGQSQPEILAEAKMGHIDEDLMPDAFRQKVFSLLNGSIPSREPQAEAYHLLVVAACNYYNKNMPFMFEKIADYTELLIPDDLLSGNSILAYTRDALTPDVCLDVEVIGWLYQFYISEKKDEVFDGLKKNKKITPENIPAATQLFTPHWIVRYLVENSLGRLWMLNRPSSMLIDQMDYYIKPETPETDFLRISKPEEIKLCDPASGSGHMLTYSYDLLYAIYEEEGYDANDIPSLILVNNLFGIEIDERAGELAAFALTMKAAKGNPRDEKSNHRRFFRNPIQPNICVLQNIHFEDVELKNYMDAVGRDLFTVNLQTMLHQFREADNFGSLIKPEYADAASVLRKVEEKNLTYDLFLQNTHELVLLALRQADYLNHKYHVVVANPPYMGGGGMNSRLKTWATSCFPDSKSDLFSMFIDRNLQFGCAKAYIAMVTMQNWMFISSFEKIRKKVLRETSIRTLIQIGFNSFPELNSKYALAAAFVLQNGVVHGKGDYINLNDAPHSARKGEVFINKKSKGEIYRVENRRFLLIPGAPIQYSFSKRVFELFESGVFIRNHAETASGLQTNDNSRFLRFWSEISYKKIGFTCRSRDEAQKSQSKWFQHVKGGPFRKWYGNLDYVVNWQNDGEEIFSLAKKLYGSPTRTVKNLAQYFKPGASWTDISAGQFAVRKTPEGSIFDTSAPSLYSAKHDFFISLLNSRTSEYLINALCPSLHYLSNDVASLPLTESIIKRVESKATAISHLAQKLARSDWDSYETSWNFTSLPLLNPEYIHLTLKSIYQKLRTHWREMTFEMQELEEENNRIFIDAYGLQDELTPEVPLSKITLTCNPHYRYGRDKTEAELEVLFLSDTMRELVSYAVGCMFGRYTLDKPGLILANQGETIEDYLKWVTELSFPADEDNVIPILDEGWFTDDVTERFRKFLKITFGAEHYEENLAFLEDAIGKDIRKYFLKDFYADHLKRYKKRPIYWLFSSPKGSFNALIYMHRYRPDTVSVVLNDYLREFRTKLSARKEHLDQISISASASPKEKTQALKDLEKLRKIIDELDDYERETLYPLAAMQIAIDLDDGVMVNYPKFGDALKKIPGLDASEE